MKPSRTYTLGIAGILAELLLAAAGLLAAFTADPATVSAVAELLGTLGLCAAGCAGAGAGAMGLRDYGSGGLTSSQAGHVLQSAQHRDLESPVGPHP